MGLEMELVLCEIASRRIPTVPGTRPPHALSKCYSGIRALGIRLTPRPRAFYLQMPLLAEHYALRCFSVLRFIALDMVFHMQDFFPFID